MVLKRGYKQTNLGIFPEDWSVSEISKVCELVVDCKNRTPPVVENGDYAVVRTPNVRNGSFIRDELRFTDEKSYREWTARAIPQPGDVLITREAPLGEVCLVPTDLRVCLGQRMMLYRPDQSKAVDKYLLYALSSTAVKRNLLSKIGGSTVGHAKVDDIRNLQIPLPANLPEQRAIAAALSDVDALLASLDALIAKKRLIQQGAMQELLAGKRRLPGFSGEWEVKRLGELLAYEQPGKYIVKSSDYVDKGDTPVLTAGKTFILGFTNEAEGIYQNLPVIVFDDFTLASRYVDFPFKVKSSAIKLLKTRDQCNDLRFIYEKMQLIKFSIGDHKRYYISEYQHCEIEIPSIAEQKAIVAVLSDMDTEIHAIEQQRDKTHQIKQGMMQELLTGRIRLNHD